MQANNWILIDKDSNRVVDELHIAGADVSQAAEAAKVEYRRLHGGRQEGLHMLSIDNGAMRVSIIPERGMGIWKAWSGEVELGWQSPIDGPVHPNWVPLHEPTGLGWLGVCLGSVWVWLGLVRVGFWSGLVWFGLALICFGFALGWVWVGFGLAWAGFGLSLVWFELALGLVCFGLGWLWVGSGYFKMRRIELSRPNSKSERFGVKNTQ